MKGGGEGGRGVRGTTQRPSPSTTRTTSTFITTKISQRTNSNRVDELIIWNWPWSGDTFAEFRNVEWRKDDRRGRFLGSPEEDVVIRR